MPVRLFNIFVIVITLISFAFGQSQYPPAPLTPKIFAAVDHNRIIISWDAVAEKSIDSLTGYADFEGYRLYRSTDGGHTWGDVYDKLFDYDGNFVGWKPIAQFDLSADDDKNHCVYTFSDCGNGPKRGIEISGPDPLAPRINLGNNSGINYTYIDDDIIDGVEYTYTITAYDMGVRGFELIYTDNNVDGIFEVDTVWSPTNPDRFPGPDGDGYPSLESPKGQSPADQNYITAIAGYRASNISFPDENDVNAFLKVQDRTVGTGERSYIIVDENELTGSLLKFEVQAFIAADALEGMALDNPQIFVYEIDDSINQNPLFTIASLISSYSPEVLDSLLSYPGVDSGNAQLFIPDYITSFKPGNGNENIWSDLINGIRVRYNNLPESVIGLDEDFELINALEWYADSSVIKNVYIEFEYIDDNYELKPNFDYLIEFSSTVLDTPIATDPSQPCSDHAIMQAVLPFRITNLSTGKRVKVRHADNGLFDTRDPNIISPGRYDCTWTSNELIKLDYDTLLVGDQPDVIKTYKLRIAIDLFSAFVGTFIPAWDDAQLYSIGDYVYYEGMVWKASENIIENIEPIAFIDENGDGINENPWQIQYPWNDGDYVIIRTKKFFADGDSWIADLSQIDKSHKVTQNELARVKVVPNPYVVHSQFNETPNLRQLRFTHLPQQCKITIFTVTGEKVAVIDHDNAFDGNEFWDLRTVNNQEVSPGLYLYVVESGNKKQIGKFAVVR